ncbi:molybdopterin-binding protein [Desulfobacterota bacterium M19]
MRKSVPVDEAVGMVLPHDITEIRRDEFKGRAFKKGHIIQPEDVEHLKRLGKEHIYVMSLTPDEIHENEAAALLAAAIGGTGVRRSGEVVEGKISLLAAHNGLLKVNSHALYNLNMAGEVMCATLHNNRLVKEGQQVAATRLIPLISQRELVEKVVNAVPGEGIVRVVNIPEIKAGLVITGNEVFHGRIKDAFEPVLRAKLKGIGSEVITVRFAPDNTEIIAAEIKKCLSMGARLVVTSGGMSVDPDDVTREGIKAAGAENIVYGSPVLPGAMFLSGVIGKVPILGLPACGMFHRITIFDLILPRVLCGERITREDLAALGHGGLCQNCETCRYPVCGFGK